MPAVLTVSTWRPQPGKAAEFMTAVATAKKIHERLGAHVRVIATQFGGVPMGTAYVMEHPSWDAFGKFGEKMNTDNEWTAFWTAAQANPSAELVSNTVGTEVPL
jgi:hypothetical protein